MSNRDEITAIILEAIRQVAPDADTELLDYDEDMRDELDLDSMDFLNITIAVNRATGIAIADADASKVLTLNAMADYLLARS